MFSNSAGADVDGLKSLKDRYLNYHKYKHIKQLFLKPVYENLSITGFSILSGVEIIYYILRFLFFD